MQPFNGKRVVVIGGTSGIGLATARYLLDEGAQVMLTGRSEVLGAVSTALPGAIILRSDIGSLPDIQALASQVEKALGVIDLLFVNAGINTVEFFGAATEQIYDQTFLVNAKGPYFTVQTLAPLVTDGGAIVLTTSVANVRGLPGASIYAATKAALRSMVRSFGRELLPRRIRVNAVSPGPIDTLILAKSLGKEAAENARVQFRESNPMKRMGAAEEIARAVAFISFEATYTTGAEVPVDGGASQL